ncbi:MAG: NAD-dependent epimerase/dehydratase family protein [Oscillospiraceae bacterium]|nr:NAD-dependent epimerase/dehydratase family protein [Oscillospiraceae bacterium]
MEGLSVVTGSSGYVGYALVKHLCAFGCRPRLLLRGRRSYLEEFGCESVKGDVLDYPSLCLAFEGASVVYHAAGLIDVAGGRDNDVWEVNVVGTANVVRACKACGVKRLIYLSSVDAIPPLPEPQIMQEIDYFTPTAVSGTYAKTKATATQLVLDSATNDFSVVCMHPSAVCGPYDYVVSSFGTMVRMCVKGAFPVTMDFGGYNFVDTRDVAAGCAAAADSAVPSGCYILSGEYMTCSEMIATLSELTGHQPPKIVLSKSIATAASYPADQYYKLLKKTPLFTPYSIRKLCENGQFSHEKASRELGFQPRSARESLTDMIAWIRSQK